MDRYMMYVAFGSDWTGAWIDKEIDEDGDWVKASEAFAEIDSLRAEVEALRKCCTQRGARMQIMREWLDSQYGIGPPTEWWYFCEETPGAEHWFDADGVPVEYAALRGEEEK